MSNTYVPYQQKQLVEVSGLKDEGFPGSFMLAVVVEPDHTGANVQYLEVISYSYDA